MMLPRGTHKSMCFWLTVFTVRLPDLGLKALSLLVDRHRGPVGITSAWIPDFYFPSVLIADCHFLHFCNDNFCNSFFCNHLPTHGGVALTRDYRIYNELKGWYRQNCGSNLRNCSSVTVLSWLFSVQCQPIWPGMLIKSLRFSRADLSVSWMANDAAKTTHFFPNFV